MLTYERSTAVVLAEVVPDVAGLLEGYVAAFDQTFVIGSSFARSLVQNTYNFHDTCWYSSELIFQIFSDKDA